jgi:hypothetical protein
MADERYATRQLLVLRKTTRLVADYLRGQVKDYLTTLAPLLRPRGTLGEHAGGGGSKENVPGADKALKELQGLYEALAATKFFALPRPLTTPLAVLSTSLDLTPLEYDHVAQAGSDSKTITVTAPFRWVLNYGGFTPRRLRDLLAARDRTRDELQQWVLHDLMLHVALGAQTGVGRLLEALRFPVSTIRCPEFGDLPITCISAPLSTLRPPDDVLIENTEVSGRDVFEEVINLDEVPGLRDPLRDKVIELVRSQGADLVPAGGVGSPAGEAGG